MRREGRVGGFALRALCAMVAASLLGCSPAAETAPQGRQETEAYAIYSVYLDYLAAENELMKNRKVAFIVSADQDACRDCDDLDRLFPAGALRPETVADFRRRAGRPFTLKPALRLPHETYVLAGAEPKDRSEDGATTVRMSLSPVGFDNGFTQGLFRVDFAIHECRGGGEVLMQRSGDLWAVAQDVISFLCR